MKRRLGFTIVEIIVVITAISILAAIGTVTYSGMQVRTRDTERRADIDTMGAALETYYEKFGKYPDHATIAGANFIENDLNVPSSALVSPSSTGATAPFYSYLIGTSANSSQYGYLAYRDTGTSNQCTLTTQTCTRYVLTYVSEQAGLQTVRSKFGN